MIAREAQFNVPKWITNLCGNPAAPRVVPGMLTPCHNAASAPGRRENVVGPQRPDM
jgi:hypothetical protein